MVTRGPDRVDPPGSAEVVIIGAGIVGAASAFFLRRTGFRPVVVEAAVCPGARTTAMSAFAIRAQFSEPENIAMMRESLESYERLDEITGIPGAVREIRLTQQGYLFASTNEADVPAFAARIAKQRAAGLDDVEQLDGDEVRRRYPWLSPAIVTASFRQRDGWLDGVAATSLWLRAAGVPVVLDCRVTGLLSDRRGICEVRTTRGDIATRTVVLAAGPASREMSPEPLPLTLLRRHRIIVNQHERIPQYGPMTIDANTGAHWRPSGGGALVAWAQPEMDSAYAWPVSADAGFPDLALRSTNGIGRLAPFWRELAKSLTPDDVRLTAGQYTVTSDHMPLIGPAVQTPGLWLHTGYSGHGIMGSPAGARMLADTMAGQPGGTGAFRPDRFVGAIKPPDVERIVL